MRSFEITTLNGTPPFFIYVCDASFSVCDLIDVLDPLITPLPVTYIVPDIYDRNTNVFVKIVDSEECEVFELFSCTDVTPPPTNTVTPTLTPTLTPTQTPTNTVTPSITKTPTQTPSITPTNTVTPSNTPTNTVTPSITKTPTQTPRPSRTPTRTPAPTTTPTSSICVFDVTSTVVYVSPTPTITPSTSTCYFDVTSTIAIITSTPTLTPTTTGCVFDVTSTIAFVSPTPSSTDCSFDVNSAILYSTPTPSEGATPVMCTEPTSVSPNKGGSWILNNITLTHNWTGSVQTTTYLTQVYNYCVTYNVYMFPGTVAHLGVFGPFEYWIDFSSPVNDVTVLFGGAGWPININSENFIFTTDTGTPSINVVYSCLTTLSGNEIITGYNSDWSNNLTGSGKLIINNSTSFTKLIIKGDGGIGGTLFKFCFNYPQPTQTPTKTTTPTLTPTNTITITPTKTITPTVTKTQTPTVTPTITKTITPTVTKTQTPTVTKTQTPTVTPTPTLTPTTIDVDCICFVANNTTSSSAYVTYTECLGGTPISIEVLAFSTSQFCAVTILDDEGGITTNVGFCPDGINCDITPTPTTTPTETITPTPTTTPTETITQTPSITPTDPMITPSNTPTETITPTITPTNTSTPTITPTQTPAASPLPPSPIDLTLAAWYDASTNVDMQPTLPASGNTITQWNDKGSGQHNLSSGAAPDRPQWFSNVQNGLGALYFNGVDLQSANQFDIIANATGITMFIVCKFITTTAPQIVISNDYRDTLLSISGSTVRYTVGMAGGIASDSSSTVDTNFHIHSIKFDGTQTGNENRLKYRLDKTSKILDFGSTIVGTATNSNGNILYSGSLNDSENLNGYIGEVIIYERVLTDIEVIQTENYLASKWNL